MFETIIKTIGYVIAFLMLTSGYDKIKNFSVSKSKIEAYQIIPKKIIKVFLVLGISIEIFIGLSLLTNFFNLYALILYISLMIIYSFAIFKNILKGNVLISCGCGGVLESDFLSKNHLYRNTTLIILGALNYFYSQGTTFTAYQILVMLLIAVSFIFMYGSLKEYQRQLNTIKKINKRLTI